MAGRRPQARFLFRDILLNTALLFVAVTIILLPHINPVAKKTDDVPPGTLNIGIAWDKDRNVDVDLWVKAPGDNPVGFKRTAGLVFDLLRDDVGFHNDMLHLNYENAYSRGLPDGDYIINLHYYRGEQPIVVETELSIRGMGAFNVRFGKIVQLLHKNDEITLWRLHIVKGIIVTRDEIFQKVTPF